MPGFFKSIGNFLTGTPEKRENVSTLLPEQEGLYEQLVGAGKGAGVGGAFGTSADYYRNLLNDNSADYQAFSAPMMRQYNQDIMPGISEQFAGMGSGGLSSSGFRNAQVQGTTDLAERLGSIRANLRQAGAQGLQNIGQLGLGNYSQNMMTQPGTEGFLSQIAPLAGTAAGAFFGGPSGAAIGNSLGNWFSGKMGGGSSVGANSSPYGSGGPQASPPNLNGGFRLPNFLQGTGRGF
ncbi:MAG TPA: hypothetical protein VN843_31480 [Anaerolineales bacterium]|nr:hypothetical protein [Anaerolineales bacterium]